MLVSTSFLCGDYTSCHCFVMQFLMSFSSFEIIFLRKRDLVALLLACGCLCFLFLVFAVPLVGLWFVSVAFLDILIRLLVISLHTSTFVNNHLFEMFLQTSFSGNNHDMASFITIKILSILTTKYVLEHLYQ